MPDADFVPIDHDPFSDNAPPAPALLPVEHDPFRDDAGVAGPPQPLPSPLDALADTWPARLAKSAYGALTLPGDVYAGKVPMTDDSGHTSPELIDRSADLAGLVTGGSYAAPAQADAAGMGIRAFHGSPHDFEKFDMSKIGTGEGAQVYGHGLYFAENPAVAQEYRDKLSGASVASFRGKPLSDLDLSDPATRVAHDVATMVEEHGVSPQSALEYLEGQVGDLPTLRERRAATQALHSISPDDFTMTETPGRMYEVNLDADPEHFLDWDKPIAQQHPRVSDAIFDALHRSGVTADEANHFANNKTGEDVVRRIARPSFPIQDAPGAPFKASGANSFEEALAMVGGDKMRVRRVYTPDPTYTAQALRDAGVKGIKYLDQGSRGVDGAQATRNYVLFDDRLINVVRKYGIAGLSMVPPAILAAGMKPVDHDPFE